MVKHQMSALKSLIEGKGKDPVREATEKARALLDKALGLSIKDSQKAYNLAHQAASIIAQAPGWDENPEGQSIHAAALALNKALSGLNAASMLFLKGE